MKAAEFHSIEVLDTDLVNGAATSLHQLRGQTTADPIYANEQIPVMRLVVVPQHVVQEVRASLLVRV